jgi:hypothetical protein
MTPALETESLEVLERNLRTAAQNMAKATAEAQRLTRVQYQLQSDIADVTAKLKAIKIKALDQMAMQRPKSAAPYFEEAALLRKQRDDLRDALSYVASFSLEAAVENELRCTIAEREASIVLFIGQGADLRKRAMEIASQGAEIDPGFSVDHSGTRSQSLYDQAAQIARTLVDVHRPALAKRIKQASDEQSLVAPRLFNQ